MQLALQFRQERLWGPRYVITTRGDMRVLAGRDMDTNGQVTGVTLRIVQEWTLYYRYSRGRRNSSPKILISPSTVCRRTLAVIGGVSLGTKLEEEADGAGIV